MLILKMSKTLFLDAGHGGVDLKGNYTTAPGKMWKHPSGIFHNATTFYEGVSNRTFADLLAKEFVSRGVNVVKTYHPFVDNSLKSRIDTANFYHKNVNNGILLSLHSDAVNIQDKARGLAVWTSKGQTKSDIIADRLIEGYEKDLLSFGITMRKDVKDGDKDYEDDFYVLVNSTMEAVLVENLFFDNKKDAEMLMNPEYQRAFVNSTVNTFLPLLK